MKITTAGEIQKNYKAGLFITGENDEGELEWLGTDNQWKLEEQFANEADNIRMAELSEASRF